MTKKQIEEICEDYNIFNYTINSDLSIDVNQDLDLEGKGLDEMPLKFNKINGSFNCGSNHLTSLKNSPIEVTGSFFCHNNNLTSLEYSPKFISSDFYCSDNKLTSFEGNPKIIGGDFYCDGNEIVNLDGLSIDKVGNFYLSNNPLNIVINGDLYSDKYVDSDIIYSLRVFKVIKDRTVNFKRLKYVLSNFKREISLKHASGINKSYTIVNF